MFYTFALLADEEGNYSTVNLFSMAQKMSSIVKRALLQGGGEMGQLIRDYNWSTSKLGDPDIWPQSLKITLNILLNSKFPMFLWWGPDLICFYNDAYRPSLGRNGKHPGILVNAILTLLWRTYRNAGSE